MHKYATWMDITHPGQQLIFYFDIFVEFVLNILHCSFHVLEKYYSFWFSVCYTATQVANQLHQIFFVCLCFFVWVQRQR